MEHFKINLSRRDSLGPGSKKSIIKDLTLIVGRDKADSLYSGEDATVTSNQFTLGKVSNVEKSVFNFEKTHLHTLECISEEGQSNLSRKDSKKKFRGLKTGGEAQKFITVNSRPTTRRQTDCMDLKAESSFGNFHSALE